MKKYIILGIITLAVILGGGIFALFSALSGGPWEGVWWGVQEAGMNWSGDNIRNLETITFTRNDDKTITVDHSRAAKKWKAAFQAREPLTAAVCLSPRRQDGKSLSLTAVSAN